jgi:hypothetical protein
MQQQSAVGIAQRPGPEAIAKAQLRESALKGERRETMKPYRGNAIAVGVLLIACSAASILSAIPLGSTLDGSDYLSKLAVSGNGVVLTALIEFVWAATAAGIAIGLYPVLRKYNRSLALGSVVGRTVEGMLILVGTLSLLALLTLGQESAVAGQAAASSSKAVGDMLLAVRDWANGFLVLLSFAIGALMYYYLLYRSRLVPRWLSGWGLIGAGLLVGSTVYSGFTQDFGFTTVNTALNIPIGLQEMVLAVWLIVKGFKASALASVAPAGGSGGRS